MATAAGLVTKAIPGQSLHISRPTWWLESRFHFSFAEHFDPKRNNFGVLRVVNDDLVQPRAGFGTHPHRDMEIFSYVVDGKLSHCDSIGNQESIGRGGIQYMSAGTGVYHSEMNSEDEPLRFLQIWIMPDRRGHAPQYGQRMFSKADRHNRFVQMLAGTKAPPPASSASGGGGGGGGADSVIRLHQDVNVYASECDAGKAVQYQLRAGRQGYAVCIEGSVTVNDTSLQMRDAVELVASEKADVEFVAGKKGCHLLLIEMAKT